MDDVYDSFAQKQRFSLHGFYIASLAFAFAVGLAGHLPHAYRLSLLSLAAVTAICGAISLVQFFRTTDEFRQNVNRRAIQFAFVGSLLASVAVALLQSFGMRSISPYALPALMIGFWSIGLFFSARRFE